MTNPEFQTESLISRYQNDTMSSAFMASQTEVIKDDEPLSNKDDEPLSNSEEITKIIENSEFYKRGFEDARKKYERPTGEWIIRHKRNWYGQDVVCFECNQCGEYKVPIYHALIIEPLNVCPNCGINMRVKDELGGGNND